MSEIKKILAREILDSRGNPTVEVDLFTEDFFVRSAVPSGASTGSHEALEVRDGNERYNGKGVQKAVDNVNKKIRPSLIGLAPTQQRFIDNLMVQLDKTTNKSNLGANAILAVSLAVCRAGAKSKKIELYQHIADLAGTRPKMPIPFFNVLNGGKHAGNNLDFQEFMIVPVGAVSFKQALQMGTETYHALREIIKDNYGVSAVNVGDEGGFAPPFKTNEEPLKMLVKAISKAGYADKIKIAIDAASSVFYSGGKYLLNSKNLPDNKFKSKAEKEGLTGKELSKIYLKWIAKYPIFSIEDPFAEDDWDSWSYFTTNSKVQVIGDDLLVTNTHRIKTALERKACNSLLLKVNQIGTLSEAIDASSLASVNGWKVMVSHRSGETEDSFIADLAVGLGIGQIKAGAPCRGERISKYNQLLRLEEVLY